jgi:general secretion pathway protein J
LEDGEFKRVSWPMLDGATPSAAATLLQNVESVEVEFRDDMGQWRADWTATDVNAIPRAVALRIKLKGQAEERMLFLVGPQTRVPPPQSEGGDAG